MVVISQSNELYHHGIKGQKWGIRNYQNPDGSLTPEGRLRYGYGSVMSQNTKERVKQGAKIGTKIGAAIGTATAGLGLGLISAAGPTVVGFTIPPAAAVAIGATFIGTWTASGAAQGALTGGIYGAIETHAVRKFMKNPLTLNVKVNDLQKHD